MAYFSEIFLPACEETDTSSEEIPSFLEAFLSLLEEIKDSSPVNPGFFGNNKGVFRRNSCVFGKRSGCGKKEKEHSCERLK